jgi:diacylglycerol kinase family enzyme
MPKTKFHFLINPISGGGQGKVVFDFLPEIMRSMAFADSEWKRELSVYENFETQIKQAFQSTECLIAVGGDGTAASIFTVLLQHKEYRDVKIGLIPLGTGNDLARVLNLYTTYVEKGLLHLVRKLVQASSRKFDLWQVNGKYAMANYFSAGIDARIAHDFNRDRKEGKIRGNSVIKNKLHYVKRFFADRSYRLKTGEFHIKDNTGEKKIYDLKNCRTVLIGNIPSFASGSNPFGKSNIADGLLEILRITSIKTFLKAITIGAGRLILKAKEIDLHLSETEFIQLDGEDYSGKLQMPVQIRYGTQINMLYL